MKSLRYLNFILTVLTVLLGLQIWTSWQAQPQLSVGQEAIAAKGIPNAEGQRQVMINQLKRLNSQTDVFIQLFRTGQARVTVKD